MIQFRREGSTESAVRKVMRFSNQTKQRSPKCRWKSAQKKDKKDLELHGENVLARQIPD